jgi:hypothetical protein
MSSYTTPFELQQPRSRPAGLTAFCLIPIVPGVLGPVSSMMEKKR